MFAYVSLKNHFFVRYADLWHTLVHFFYLPGIKNIRLDKRPDSIGCCLALFL